ncbi:hypothetical protein P2318_05715 [Myxococcaceae bacterium GXIMD 01537]
MSSSTDVARPVTLSVRAQDPESEIFVVDGSYQLAGRGLGEVRGEYAPGLYKVKIQTGSRIWERYVRLEPGSEELLGEPEGATLEREDGGVVLSFPRLYFATAMPLAETSWAREEHTHEAIVQSRRVHARIGRGSQLFVFIRTWTHAPAPGNQPGIPASFELSLHALDGRRLVDLVAEGAWDDDLEDPWAACNVELDPGAYLLRRGTDAGFDLDQVVVASPGWQTQVFLCELQRRDDSAGEWLGSTHSSIHLRRPGEGFNPDSPGLRLTELTRIGLRNRRPVITPELLRELRETVDRNPMLGLYGAHLLMLSETPDLDLVRKVVEHLRALLGRHPDVEALALRLGGDTAASATFPVPPMLLRGWTLVVRETVSHPEIVPRGSLSAAIGDRLWGEGPWLIWKALSAPAAQRAPVSSGDSVEALVTRLQAVPAERLQALREATALERALIAHVRGERPALPVEREGASLPLPTRERMVRALGVPAATLEAALVRLLARLEGPPSPPPLEPAHPA